MKSLVNVARYHLVDRVTYVAMPWGIMAFSFLVNAVVSASVLANPGGSYTGGLLTIYVFLLVCGVLSMTRSLPFGLMLGISRAPITWAPRCWSWCWAPPTASG